MMVLINSRPFMCNDPMLLEMMGLDIGKIRTLVVKARGSYKVAFDEYIALENMIQVDTLGRTSPVLTRYPWKNLPRPVYPVDRDFEWSVPEV